MPKKKNPKPSKKDDPFHPTEITVDEYKDLVGQVRTEFSESECEEELRDAARHDDIDVVRAILQVHPELHQRQDRHGNTALHMAAANGHVQTTHLLLRLGADASLTNETGNTPLHWASTNGHDDTVQALLQQQNVDVLQQNEFGRSALTEGFTSQSTAVVKSLLEHDSANEERLVENTTTAGEQQGDHAETTTDGGEEESSRAAITHDLVFQGVPVRARELAMAESSHDKILGQVNPLDDTTGLGIWASSLVLAQWLVSKVKQPEDSWIDSFASSSSSTSSTEAPIPTCRIVELGAGCGVPSLAMAAAFATSEKKKQRPMRCHIYATDFNPKSVDNLQHNVELNQSTLGDLAKVEATVMNWQDSNTWPTKEPVDCIIGSDLIYQSDMVPCLIQTIVGLLETKSNDATASKKKSAGRCFLYVTRADGERQGHQEFLQGMESAGFVRSEQLAPTEHTQANLLASQDDDLCFLHFHELQSMQYKLFEFTRPN